MKTQLLCTFTKKNHLTDTINIIVECKAPNINISQDIFYQIAKYNFILRSQFLIVTNGIKHFCCKMDYQRNTYDFIAEIPNYVES